VYRTASLAQRWGTLASRARTDNEEREAHLLEMMKRQEEIADLYSRGDSLRVELESGKFPVTTNAEWPAVRVQVEQMLGVNAPDARAALEKFEGMDGPELLADFTEVVDLAASAVDAAVTRELLMLTGATLALAVAGFNEHVLSMTVPGRPSAAFHDEVKASLDVARRQVWETLKGPDLVVASTFALELARLASRQTEGGLIHIAAISTRRRTVGSSFVDDGRLALQLGALMGELMHAITLGWYVAWLTKGHGSQEALRSWVSAAKTFPFATTSSPRATVDLSTLAGRPDGDPVSIEGVIDAMDLLGANGAAIASISDGHGETVDIFSSEAGLDTQGMSPGAYVHVSGRWQSASNVVNGPAVLIDTVHLPDSPSLTWDGWVIDQMRPILAPSALAARCSWEPGNDGAANPLQYGSWFVS